MTFEEILDQAIAMLQRRRRLTYSTLKRQFQLDDAARGSPATAARTVARRRATPPGLRLSFVPHLRYNEPDRLYL